MERLGEKHADKMYNDKESGETVHVGYAIGGLWIRLFEVIPMERKP